VGAFRKGIAFRPPAVPPSSSAAPTSPATVRARVPFQPARVSAPAPPGAPASQAGQPAEEKAPEFDVDLAPVSKKVIIRAIVSRADINQLFHYEVRLEP
jgi:hypothetical protein